MALLELAPENTTRLSESPSPKILCPHYLSDLDKLLIRF